MGQRFLATGRNASDRDGKKKTRNNASILSRMRRHNEQGRGEQLIPCGSEEKLETTGNLE